MGKTRCYVLKNNYKPVSWQLRNRPLVFNEKKNSMQTLIYVKGGNSIWLTDYEKGIKLRTEDVWFEDGVLMVNPKDTLLIKYLEHHPDFNLKFKLDDPEADAKLKLKKMKQIDRVKSEMSKMTSFDALVEALRRKDEVTLHLSPSQKELRCYEESLKDPEKVLKAIGNPKTQTQYLATLALSKGIIRLNTSKTEVVWGDNGETIVQLPFGQKPAEFLTEFLFEPKSEGTLLELSKRVEGLNSKASAKRKAAKEVA